MKHPLLVCSATIALLISASVGAQAQPVAGLAKSGGAGLEAGNSTVINVGWKAKRRTNARHRNARRAHRNNRRGFRSHGRRSEMMPYIMPGVASMLIQRRKCLDAIFPGDDPACN